MSVADTASGTVKAGDRVELVAMPEDPDPIPAGTRGTVIETMDIPGGEWSRSYTQVFVRWDNGRSLSCVCPPDVLTVLPAG